MPLHTRTLASVLVCALAAPMGAASAKTLSDMAPQSSAGPRAAPVADDGLKGGGFYLEADTVTQNQTTHHIVATGGVEARYKNRVLRAKSVDYDTQTGVVQAAGKVMILQPDGSAQFAEFITLDKTLSEGFARGFSTRLQGHVKISAASVRRKSSQVTEFQKVIYTPCVVCAENGRRHPTWSIRARSVVEDKAHKTLTFKGAVVEVLGQGIFYFPVLQSADPTAKRKSGFLLPIVTFSGPRGVSYEQPYYQVINSHQDILLTPQINSEVNPFLNVDYRQRFYSGLTEIRAGYTYSRDFTSNGTLFGRDTSRSYILANGSFDINKNWLWGFTAERASDKLIFDKYSISDAFIDHGLYAADNRRLISQLYVVEQSRLSYFSAAVINVQGLRATDDQSTIPTIAPLIEARWEAPGAILGGRLRVDGSAVALTRNQSMSNTDATGQDVLPGVDSRRATVQADWRRSFTFSNGFRLQPFLNARADVFNIANANSGPSDTITRGFGTVGADFSYPLFRQIGAMSLILEPLGQIAISPNVHQDPRIVNEDSTIFEFDETNLFNPNRSPGFDLYEGGQSITLAGRATAILEDGRSASFTFGRRLAARNDPAIPLQTGLQTALSDWIFAADATPIKGVRLFSRLRLDSSTFAVNRLEAGAAFSTARAEGYVSYLHEVSTPTGGKVNSLDIHGEFYPLRHWGVSSYLIFDGGDWRRRDLGVVYRDDCIRVEVLYRHDETFNGTLGPSTSVVLRLTLATLGNAR
jgi:LPS-assembly protein